MRGAHLVKAGGEWYGVRQSAYPRRAVARVPDLRRSGLHRQCAGGSAARPAGPDRRRAARQPAEPARAIWSLLRARRLARDVTSLTISAGAALRLRRRRRSTRTTARTSTTWRPVSSCAVGTATACRAAATSRIATTSRRAPASRGRSTRQRGRSCAAATASTTTRERWPRRKACTSILPYFNLSVLLPGPGPAASDARRPVPGPTSPFHPAVRDGVPARSADAVDGALEPQPAAPARRDARRRDRLRRLARPRSDLRARHEPGSRQARSRSTSGRTRCSPTSR